MRRGDYAGAQEFFAGLAEQIGPLVAPRALLLQARAALADADTDTAEAILQQLLNDYPELGPARRRPISRWNRCAGRRAIAGRACARWTRMNRSPAGRRIGPYAALQRAQCAASSATGQASWLPLARRWRSTAAARG